MSVPPAPGTQTALDIRRYETRATLDIAGKSIAGETAVFFRLAGSSPRELRFPRNELRVDGARYGGAAAAFRADEDAIVIRLPDLPPPGDEHITIAYPGTPRRGLVFGDRIIASGRLVEEHGDGSGHVHSQWEEDRPYSPYLYGFVAGELTEAFVPAGSVTLHLVGPSASESPDSLRRKFQDTARMMSFLQGRAGVPLPHDTYAQVLVPGAEAQEKSSFAVIGTQFLDPILKDPSEDWVIVHELAHQWWGNLVTCRTWSDFWLNEGMATFMVAAYKEQRWGKAAYERELALWREDWKTAIDALFEVPLAYAHDYPSLRVRRAIQYGKGALFLHTLRASRSGSVDSGGG